MDFDDDYEMNARSSRNKPTSSRRRKEAEEPLDFDDEMIDSALTSTSRTKNQPKPLPRSGSRHKDEGMGEEREQQRERVHHKPAVSGWGDEDVNFGQTSARRRREPGLNTDFNFETSHGISTKKVNQREIDKDGDIDIPEIPDLEEQIDPSASFAFQVAEAPDVQVHQISTYKELDKEFFKEKAFQFLEGNIDVSLLHCGLNTEQQTAQEDDIVWEWTKLFTEVVSAISKRDQETQKEVGIGDSDLQFMMTSRADKPPAKPKREISF